MAALLKTAHTHLLASKLRTLFDNSPLIFVYQCLGNVRPAAIEDALQAQLQAKAPDCGAAPRSLKLKNSLLLAAAPELPVSRFLQANNFVVGWQFGGTSAQQADDGAPSSSGRPAAQAFQAKTSLADILGDLLQPGPAVRLRQATVAAVLECSMQVSKAHPIAPLAAFYRGGYLKLAHVKEWMGLDEGRVYMELLAQLEGTAEGVVESLDAGVGGHDGLLACLDAMQPDDLLSVLDARGQQAPEQQQQAPSA